MKPVAVIILNWNGAALLRKYLPSVIANTNADIADVIVADNGSTDESVKVLKEEFPAVKTLLFDQNWGFAEGYNKCVSITAYPYTVLLNSDVRTPQGWLEPLYHFMEKNPDVGAVQPKLLKDFGADDHRQVFEYAGAAGGFIDCHGFPYCRGRIFSTVEADHGQYDDAPTNIFWATGACFMVRSEVYAAVGGLDKDFFAHMEEIDLCWRMLNAGHRICYVAQSRVFHLGGGSLPQGNPRKTYLNFRNNLLLLHKNLPAKDARHTLFVRRLYDTLAFFQSLASLHFGDAKAIIRAHRHFRTMRRNYPQPATKNWLKAFPEGGRNIIVDYYLRRCKKFTDLK